VTVATADFADLGAIDPSTCLPERWEELLPAHTELGAFEDFADEHLRHTMEVPDGPPAGSPFHLYPGQRLFFGDALAFDPATGRNLYRTAGLVIPRKCGKTTGCGGFALCIAGGLIEQVKPRVYLAAGSEKQAGELWDHTSAFVNDPNFGSPSLQGYFQVFKAGISCSLTGGSIARVAADGSLNHSLNISALLADELHAWHTPKQLENWNALTSAGGARPNPLTCFITTAGEEKPDELAVTPLPKLMHRVLTHPETEVIRVHRCFTIYRNRRARIVLHVWGAPDGFAADDWETIKLANPAPWRTVERLQEDFEDETLDEAAKRRLYGNEWLKTKSAWFKTGIWEACADPKAVRAAFSNPARLCVGVDASLNRDTTAVAIATRLDDGRIAVRARVFATRKTAPAHVYFKGVKVELKIVERYIAGALLHEEPPEGDPQTRDGETLMPLLDEHAIEWLGYDPRYFNRSAEMLSEEGIQVVEYQPNAGPTWQAFQDFYAGVLEQTIVHEGDLVVNAHVAKTAGEKTERGWKIKKLQPGAMEGGRTTKESAPIDAVPAMVFAVDLVRLLGDGGDVMQVYEADGTAVEVDDDLLDAMFGDWPSDDELDGDPDEQEESEEDDLTPHEEHEEDAL
jgi:phage terminase large subunit-like protein